MNSSSNEEKIIGMPAFVAGVMSVEIMRGVGRLTNTKKI